MSIDRLCTLITILLSDNQHLTIWFWLAGLIVGVYEIAYSLGRYPFQPHVQGPPINYKSCQSVVPITDGFPLPTVDWLCRLQTLTCSILVIYHSLGKPLESIVQYFDGSFRVILFANNYQILSEYPYCLHYNFFTQCFSQIFAVILGADINCSAIYC